MNSISVGEPLGGRGPPLTLREAEQRHATRSLEIQTEQLAQQLAQLQRQLQQVAQQVAQLQRQLELHAAAAAARRSRARGDMHVSSI